MTAFGFAASIKHANKDITYDPNGSSFRDVTLAFLDPNQDGMINVSGVSERTADAYGTIIKDSERDIVLSLLEEMDALGTVGDTKGNGEVSLDEARAWVLAGIKNYTEGKGSAKVLAKSTRELEGGQDLANRIEMYHTELKLYARQLGWQGN